MPEEAAATPDDGAVEYGATPEWQPARPRLRPLRLLLSWVTNAVAIYAAALLVPGVSVEGILGALFTAVLIAVLNALIPPLIAALRLPFTLPLGFIIILALDALMILLAASLSERTFQVDSFWAALAVSLVAAAVSGIIEAILGTGDDQSYSLRVVQRVAKRAGGRDISAVPGILYLEIDGLSKPVLRRAVRDGHAPVMARWLAGGSHRLLDWETDLSSQTGASQAGLLMGSNDNMPAFRWVEKESGRTMTCSAPKDCAEIEKRHVTGHGLLAKGGASRSNLLSGEADHVILTVSRIDAEKRANPGYRAYLANGHNVVRTLVQFLYELLLEWSALAKSRRRDIQPRGHRPLSYSFVRAGLAVAVRDLTVFSVLTDMMKGRPAIYACFAGYDEVAHHSGLERTDTLEVLRKIDQHIGYLADARKYAARPYEIVVLSDHGQTQGATFKQRNGYGLDELVERNLRGLGVERLGGGDENDSAVSLGRARGHGPHAEGVVRRTMSATARSVVLGSGNLGLIYLMDEPRRLTLEEIDERHPELLMALRAHPHVGWLLVRSAEHGASGARGAQGANYLTEGRVEGEDPLAPFSPTAASPSAAHRRLRARRRHHGQQLLRRTARRGMCLRGAHLLPRRHGRPTDATVPAASRPFPDSGGADRRRRGGAPSAPGLARHAAGRRRSRAACRGVASDRRAAPRTRRSFRYKCRRCDGGRPSAPRRKTHSSCRRLRQATRSRGRSRRPPRAGPRDGATHRRAAHRLCF